MTQSLKQSTETQKGEIAFRRKLSRQERGEELCFPEAFFGEEEIMPVLAQRIDESRQLFGWLRQQGVTLSPFLEVGAERGQRSLVLQNDFGGSGFALDLSLDALGFGTTVRDRFRFTAIPIRVCADAYNLPFRSDVFPFVFCFATLHHFPHPLPIVQEVKRVLQDGGHFFFDSEPTRGRLTVRLWTRRGYKLSCFERLLRRAGFLGFVSDGGGLEREYYILENAFPLTAWEQCLALFDPLEVQVNRTLKLRFDPAHPSAKRTLADWVGGVTRVLCRVHKESAPVRAPDWVSMLRCPTCSTDADEAGLKWVSDVAGLRCPRCGTAYPQRNSVLILLGREQQRTLYPGIGGEVESR